MKFMEVAMPRRILVIVGHPDPHSTRLCRTLANAYAQGAREAGHAVEMLDIAGLDIPLMRTKADYESAAISPVVADAITAIRNAEHVVIVFPLWLGTMPALLKAFLEQVIRPGAAFDYPAPGQGHWPIKRLGGRTARIIVTMSTPAPIYRFWYLGHGTACLKRNILNFAGISPVRETVLGMADKADASRRDRWLERMRKLGQQAL